MPSTAYTFTSDQISIRAKEPFLTEKINQRDFGVLAYGTYEGFDVEPGVSDLSLTISPQGGVALVRVSGDYLLSVRSSSLNVDLSAYPSQTVVVGIVGTYTTSSTTATIRIYTLAEYLALVNPELVVVICTVAVPASGAIPDANITYTYRTDSWDKQAPNAVPSISNVPGLNSDLWTSAAESNLTWTLGGGASYPSADANVGASTPSTFTTASYISTPIHLKGYNLQPSGGFPSGYTKPWILRVNSSVLQASTTPGAGTIRIRVIYADTTYETLNLDGDVADTFVYKELAFIPSDEISEIRVEFNGYTTAATNTQLFSINSLDLFIPRVTQAQAHTAYTRVAVFRTTFIPENLSSKRGIAVLNPTDDTLDVSALSSGQFVRLRGVNGLVAGATRDTNVPGVEVASTGTGNQVTSTLKYDTYSDIEYFDGTVTRVKRINGNLAGSVDTTDWTLESSFNLDTGILTVGSRDPSDAATWSAGSPPNDYVNISGGLLWPGSFIGIGKQIGSPLDIDHVYRENIVKSKGTITANSSGSPTLAGDYNVGAVTAVNSLVTVPFDTNLSNANYSVNINILDATGTPIYVPKVLSRAVGNFTFEVYNLTGAALYDFDSTSGLVVMFTVV